MKPNFVHAGAFLFAGLAPCVAVAGAQDAAQEAKELRKELTELQVQTQRLDQDPPIERGILLRRGSKHHLCPRNDLQSRRLQRRQLDLESFRIVSQHGRRIPLRLAGAQRRLQGKCAAYPIQREVQLREAEPGQEVARKPAMAIVSADSIHSPRAGGALNTKESWAREPGPAHPPILHDR